MDEAKEWASATLWRAPNGSSTYTGIDSAQKHLTHGTAGTPLTGGLTTIFDHEQELFITTTNGAFATKTELEVRGGENLVAYGRPGYWELMKFLSFGDITNKSTIESFEYIASHGPGGPAFTALASDGAGVLYSMHAGSTEDLLISYNIIDPLNPIELDRITTTEKLERGIYGNSHIYATTGTRNRLVIVDVSNPSAMVETAVLFDASYADAKEPAVSGNFVYTTNLFGASIVATDVTDNAAPFVESTLADSGNMNGAIGVAADGDYAYVTSVFSDKLAIIDISDPSSMSVVSAIGAYFNPDEIFIYDNHAYMTHAGSARFSIIDVTDKNTPVRKDDIASSTSSNVTVSGNFAYITSQSGYSNVYDVSDKDNIVFLYDDYHLNKEYGQRGIEKYGEYIFTASRTSAFTVTGAPLATGPGISGLLRGQFGTEHAMSTHQYGDMVVLVEPESVNHIKYTQSDYRNNYKYQSATAGLDIDLTSIIMHSSSGERLKPIAPSHVKGSRVANGDLTISWIPRTRYGFEWINGDNVFRTDVDVFNVEILNGTTVVRTVVSVAGTHSVEYTAAQQVTDFGTAQASLDIKITQTTLAETITGRSAEATI